MEAVRLHCQIRLQSQPVQKRNLLVPATILQPPYPVPEYFFGTADAICFRNNTLRIHDLKTGTTPAKIEQLEIYAALFCLEYKIKPGEIDIELRLYQNNEVLVHKPTAEDILPIMDKIVHLNKILLNMEGRV